MSLHSNTIPEQEQASLADHVSVSIRQDFTEFDDNGAGKVQFLRVEVTNLHPAIESIIETIASTLWVHELVSDVVKEGFLARAQPTIEKLSRDLRNAMADDTTELVGEYVVSMVARYIIEATYGYRALPLAEIFKEQISGNPGFDYHHEKNGLLLLFGEAKYLTGKNAYGSAFSQIVKHIELKKDVKEIPDLINFMSEDAKLYLPSGKRGYSAAFSTKNKSFDGAKLISSIKSNEDFKLLLSHEALLVIAVDING